MQYSVNFIREIRAKFGITVSPQSPDIRQNSDGGISDFQISGQSLIKENCYNSRTSDDIDMTLGTVILGPEQTGGPNKWQVGTLGKIK